MSWRGDHSLNTTSRALELACVALAEKAVPYLAMCFAVMFGESSAAAAAAVSKASGGGKGSRRAEKLRGRLLGALEVSAGRWWRLTRLGGLGGVGGLVGGCLFADGFPAIG